MPEQQASKLSCIAESVPLTVRVVHLLLGHGAAERSGQRIRPRPGHVQLRPGTRYAQQLDPSGRRLEVAVSLTAHQAERAQAQAMAMGKHLFVFSLFLIRVLIRFGSVQLHIRSVIAPG